MSPKTQTFNDGVCDIYNSDDKDNPNRVNKYTGLRLENRVLGYNRVFAAQAVQQKINAIIRVPNINDIDIHDTCEISGVGRYDIVLIQNIFDTDPQSKDLTLKILEMFTVESPVLPEADS